LDNVLEVHFAASRASGLKKQNHLKHQFVGAGNIRGRTTKKRRREANNTTAEEKAHTEAATASRLKKAQAKVERSIAAERAAKAARAHKAAETAMVT